MTPMFVPRSEPLQPKAIVATGPCALALAGRLARLTDAALARLRIVALPELLIALGEEEDLPWVDGARYLGTEPTCPALFLPTTQAPHVPTVLFERAVRRRCGLPNGPLAFIAPDAVVPLSRAMPASRSSLARVRGDTP